MRRAARHALHRMCHEPHVRAHDCLTLDLAALLALLRLYLHCMQVSATSRQQCVTRRLECAEEPRRLWARGWWGIGGGEYSKSDRQQISPELRLLF
jgi:hypothetical protein